MLGSLKPGPKQLGALLLEPGLQSTVAKRLVELVGARAIV